MEARFSIVVPARNEEALLPRGLAAIDTAVERSGCPAQVIVVANRCTDRTAAIARAAGAMVVENDDRNLARTRNLGVAASRGDIIVTIDADTVMHRHALVEIEEKLRSGVVGGGCDFVPERNSAGIRASMLAVRLVTAVSRTGGVMFWCGRADFEAIGGFDETRAVGEDLDFARRLRRHGRSSGRRFVNLRSAPAVVCCRKFDTFGDWHLFSPSAFGSLRAARRGEHSSFVDRYFYDFDG